MISPFKIIKSFRGIEASREFSCILAPLPWKIADEIRQWGMDNISEQDLIEDGLEPNIHVTVKYGIHDHDPFEIRPFIKDFGPIKITLGKISLFKKDDEDVVKISVESNDLSRLNSIISNNFKHSDSFPTYIPHVTIGYVKPGLGKKYEGRKDFYGRKVILDDIEFSGNDYRETHFSL